MEEFSNSVLRTPSKNLLIDNGKHYKDTQVVLPSTSGEVCRPTELRTFRPVHSPTSSQSAYENLIASSERGESLHVPSEEVTDDQCISVEDQFISSNREEVYVQVMGKLYVSFVFDHL